MRIAIIGSGIAGLTASHLLQKRGHEVHLYETQNQLGMAAHSIDFTSTLNGATVCGDLPSRMFNRALWPRVSELYKSLGLEIAEVEAAQSYRRGDETSTLQFQMPFQWTREVIKTAGSSLLTLADSLRSGKNHEVGTSEAAPEDHPIWEQRSHFLSEINRLRNQGLSDLDSLDPNICFQDYLDRNDFSEEFCETFLFPALSSTVCTCSHEAISNYPAVILLDAMQHISGNQRLCRVAAGSRLVAARLSEKVTVNLATPVSSVETSPDGAALITDGTKISFDHIVIATQANQVAGVFADLAEPEAATLAGFQYEDVEVVVHTDEQVMPSMESEWAVFNFVANDQNHESMCTVWMNQFQTDWKSDGMTQPIFQTIRPFVEVAASKVIRRAKLQRPVVDRNSWMLWQQMREIHQQKNRRIWFCGSYAMPGIPLLESAVKSAVEIAEAIPND